MQHQGRIRLQAHLSPIEKHCSRQRVHWRISPSLQKEPPLPVRASNSLCTGGNRGACSDRAHARYHSDLSGGLSTGCTMRYICGDAPVQALEKLGVRLRPEEAQVCNLKIAPEMAQIVLSVLTCTMRSHAT